MPLLGSVSSHTRSGAGMPKGGGGRKGRIGAHVQTRERGVTKRRAWSRQCGVFWPGGGLLASLHVASKGWTRKVYFISAAAFRLFPPPCVRFPPSRFVVCMKPCVLMVPRRKKKKKGRHLCFTQLYHASTPSGYFLPSLSPPPHRRSSSRTWRRWSSTSSC